MKLITKSSTIGFSAATIISACAPSRSTAPVPAPVPTPAPAVVAKAPLPAPNPKLPPVPEVRGPLQIKVQYPSPNALISARDSNFIHGQVGNGDAALSINGVLSPVWPNGSFLGWLPVPKPVPGTDSLGRPTTLGVYELVAVVGADTARVTHTVRYPIPSTTPVQPEPVVPVSQPTFATLGALKAAAPLKGTHSAKCFGMPTCDLATPALSDSDRVVIGRPSLTGTYKWFLIPGTSVQVVGTRGDFAQVQLDGGETIWIAKADMDLAAAASTPLRVSVGAPRVERSAGWVDIVIPVSAPPAFIVEPKPKGVALTLYRVDVPALQNTLSSTDPFLSGIQRTATAERSVFNIDLTSAPFGYLALYRNGMFTLRLRRPPAVDAASPLKGLTIAVDPGHPPVGATGPTGLWEPHATLPVGFRVRDMLLAKGASVVMTRTAHEDVDLSVRPTVARKNNAHAFVSIHYNALPDGANPYRNEGTSMYWFHPHSESLAQSMQRQLLNEMGLSDKGVRTGNFAVIRGTWMPSVLAEGAFIMMPEQEAAMRSPEYQDQYARGIVQGLEDYFRSLARQK